MQMVFRAYRSCVVGVVSENSTGDTSIGTAFHIGDGFFLTARHVVEDRRITDIVQARYGRIGVIHSVSYPPDEHIDLALLSTDFNLDHYMSDRVQYVGGGWPKADAIVIGDHLDDWIGDELVLTPVLLMGFPPVPTANRPHLVAVSGEVNAGIDRYTSPHVHFIISAVPRAGFSGAPVIHAGGALLGVLTESLSRETVDATEPAFAAAISIQPIYDLLAHARVAPRANRENCYAFASDDELAMFDELLDENERTAFEARKWNTKSARPDSPGKPSPPIVDGPPLWTAAPEESPAALGLPSESDGAT